MQKGRSYAKISGSLVNRAEDLVFRDYDFQPLPERARVASHVPPFSLNATRLQKPQIAFVRGPHLNFDQILCYAPLQESFDLSVYTTCQSSPELSNAGIQVVRLPDDLRVATAMAGLEYALFDADIIFAAQIVWPYSYQAIRIKGKFGRKLIALQTDCLPFAHEQNEALKNLKQYSRPRVDMFVAATACARDALLMVGIPQEKIAVVPTGTDLTAKQAWHIGLLAALERL